jgi:hypothetical protein
MKTSVVLFHAGKNRLQSTINSLGLKISRGLFDFDSKFVSSQKSRDELRMIEQCEYVAFFVLIFASARVFNSSSVSFSKWASDQPPEKLRAATSLEGISAIFTRSFRGSGICYYPFVKY